MASPRAMRTLDGHSPVTSSEARLLIDIDASFNIFEVAMKNLMVGEAQKSEGKSHGGGSTEK
jgi:hypothetical protein